MRHIIAAILILVALGAIAAVVWTTHRQMKAAVVTLPNGMKFEFLGTAVGGSTFSTEKSWERTARKVLPKPWQVWIAPASSGSCRSGTNGLTVYLRVTDPTGAPVNAVPWDNYLAEDEAGFRHPSEGGYCSFGRAPGTTVYGLTLRAFPRRQSSFLLRLNGQQNELLATLNIPNSPSGPFPKWKPESWPINRTNGPLRLRLESIFETGRAGVARTFSRMAGGFRRAVMDQRNDWLGTLSGCFRQSGPDPFKKRTGLEGIHQDSSRTHAGFFASRTTGPDQPRHSKSRRICRD